MNIQEAQVRNILYQRKKRLARSNVVLVSMKGEWCYFAFPFVNEVLKIFDKLMDDGFFTPSTFSNKNKCDE